MVIEATDGDPSALSVKLCDDFTEDLQRIVYCAAKISRMQIMARSAHFDFERQLAAQ